MWKEGEWERDQDIQSRKERNEADLPVVGAVVPFVPQELPTASNAIHLPNPRLRIACLTGIQNQKQHYQPYILLSKLTPELFATLIESF